jgi:AraC-like DNA-binding protein
MVHASLDTTELPIEHRFAAWTELAVGANGPTVVDSSHKNDFVARIDAYELGIVRLSHLSHPPLRASGSPAAGGDYPDMLMLTHVAQGSLMERGPDRVATAQAGSILVLDMWQPSTVVNPVDVTHTTLQLPVEALGLTRAQIRALSSTTMATGEPIGGLIAYIMADLRRRGEQYEPAVVDQVTSTLLDVLGTAARVAGRTGTLAPKSLPERSRLLQIYAFMRQRLNDPGLTPHVVAAAHAISLRQLNRILEDDGQSPSDWIRRERLDRCRRDLVDPILASRPVAAIGARWGFADPVSFNRAFRRQFGMPPGEYRRRFARDGTAPDADLW